jgi:hypothetical protein
VHPSFSAAEKLWKYVLRLYLEGDCSFSLKEVPRVSVARRAAVVGDPLLLTTFGDPPPLLLKALIQPFGELPESSGGFPKFCIFFFKPMHRFDALGERVRIFVVGHKRLVCSSSGQSKNGASRGARTHGRARGT